MKKIIAICLILSFLTGCSVKYDNDLNNRNTYIDEDTCVEYFVSSGYYSKGVFSPKYNRDGTLKLNKKCLGTEVTNNG